MLPGSPNGELRIPASLLLDRLFAKVRSVHGTGSKGRSEWTSSERRERRETGKVAGVRAVIPGHRLVSCESAGS